MSVIDQAMGALERLGELPQGWGLAVLSGTSLIEYLFPPFPGDLVTVTGAMLIPTAGWPWWGVFGAVMAGATLGGAANWAVGRWLVKEQGETWLHRWVRRPGVAAKLERIAQTFDQRGAWVLGASRFMPAFRSLFFVAAGMSQVSLRAVIGWGGVSAALWNTCLLGVGWVVGYNIEAVMGVVKTYSSAVLAALALGGCVWAWRRWRQRGSGENEA